MTADKMQLRALDKDGRVLAQATEALNWRRQDAKDECNLAEFAVANLTIGSVQ